MFTGIVEQIGTVKKVANTASGYRLVLTADGLGEIPEGSSLSVNGVCLTVVEPSGDEVMVDVIPETIDRTSLAGISPGTQVNLERAMPADGRFDGHIVQGHVDGVVTITRIDETDEEGVRMVFTLPDQLAPYLVEKGSITVDGVSLTVANVSSDEFSVALIPHTLEVTTLGLRRVGDVVNLETDVLAKYVERIMNTTQ